jgi:hypothetical protein
VVVVPTVGEGDSGRHKDIQVMQPNGMGLMNVVSSVDAEQGTGACTSTLLDSRGSQDVHAQDQNACGSVRACELMLGMLAG